MADRGRPGRRVAGHRRRLAGSDVPSDPAEETTDGPADLEDAPTGDLADDAAPVDAPPAAAPPADAPADAAAVDAEPGVSSPPRGRRAWAGVGGQPVSDLTTTATAGEPLVDRLPAPDQPARSEDLAVPAVPAAPVETEGREDRVEPASAAPAAARSRVDRGTRRSRLDAPLAAVLALALLVVAVGVVDLVRRFALDGGPASVNTGQSKAAVTAALNAAPALTSYDYATTKASKLARAKPLVTASCATSYTADLARLSTTLDPLKVVETVTATSGGVQSMQGGAVTVLVFGQQTSKDSRSTAAKLVFLQVSLTMVQQGGRWLVNGVVSNGSGGTGPATC